MHDTLDDDTLDTLQGGLRGIYSRAMYATSETFRYFRYFAMRLEGHIPRGYTFNTLQGDLRAMYSGVMYDISDTFDTLRLG